MICKICCQNKDNMGFCKDIDTKGFSSHLRSAHHMTNKEYYDKFLKKLNEDICPICDKPTKFISLTKGYSKHCSTRCSSLDINVQHKVEKTCMLKYGVKHPAQLESNKIAIHSESAKNKRKITMKDKYGCISNFDLPGVREKVKQTMKNRYDCENPYNISIIKEKAIRNAHTVQARIKRHDTKKNNGWNNTTLETNFSQQLNKLNIKFMHNHKSIQYPWKVDFYIPAKKLYIEINNFWTHYTHFYNEYSENDNCYKQYLEQKSKENDFYKVNLNTWTVSDIKKRNWAIDYNLNYIVLWNKHQIDKFFEDLTQNKPFIGFIDYNQLE